MNDYEIKDSGEHREFDTGAKRDKKDGKGRYDLLPPFALHALAVHFQKGAQKYEASNWKKGIPTHEYFDSGIRHAFQFLSGDESENHLIASIWNLICLYDTKERIRLGLLSKELDTIYYDFKESNSETNTD
uniref:dATP/dGTP diphosphohydrolase N-terminal domain-containing protein n=1 Tax=viral metagenome TaxID=1070528 RepID=A0A6M3L191_9ZZZZ